MSVHVCRHIFKTLLLYLLLLLLLLEEPSVWGGRVQNKNTSLSEGKGVEKKGP